MRFLRSINYLVLALVALPVIRPSGTEAGTIDRAIVTVLLLLSGCEFAQELAAMVWEDWQRRRKK